MKFWLAIGRFIIGLVQLTRNIIFISFLFLLSVFVVAMFLPQNVQSAINIFKNLFKIP
jgi:hypothetical protein